MENEIKNNPQKDEIDLLELLTRMFNAIGRAITSFVYFLGDVGIFLIRKFIWLFTFAIIGITLGIILQKNQTITYSSILMGRLNVLNNSIIVNAITDMPLPAKDSNDVKTLARILQISDATAKKVRKIEAFYGMDTNEDGVADYIDFDKKGIPLEDTITKIVPSEFYIRVQLLDENILPSVSKGLLNYLQNNPYILKSDSIRKINLQHDLGVVNAQISRLDSLQQIEYLSQQKNNALKFSDGLLVLGEKERQLFHFDIFDLHYRRNRILIELELLQSPITIIQDFYPPLKIEKTAIKYWKTTLPIFSLLGIVCSLLWQYRKKIIELIVKKQY